MSQKYYVNSGFLRTLTKMVLTKIVFLNKYLLAFIECRQVKLLFYFNPVWQVQVGKIDAVVSVVFVVVSSLV